MDNRTEIQKLLCDFITAGLIIKDIHKVEACFGDEILGIGLGEQGFVTCFADAKAVLMQGIKADDTAVYTMELGVLKS